MKRLLFPLFLSIVVSCTAHASKTIDEVAWVVGDEPILKSDIETEIMRMRYNRQKIEGDPYCVIPEQLAIQKLFIAQAKIDSIVVTQSQVDMQVEGRLKFFIQQIGSEEKVEEYDRENEVTKRKISKKYIPPDTTAIKAVIERSEENPLEGYTDKQLSELKTRLLKELKDINEKEERNAGKQIKRKD